MIFKNNTDYSQEEVKRINETTYDAVIIGGGTSGLVSALSMLEKGYRVAIIEAGPLALYSHLSNSELRFQYSIGRNLRRSHRYGQGMPDGATFGPNISCLGGRGMFWNGASPRFNAHDFDGWPIGLKELTPHYEWMENQFRVSTVMGETKLAKSIISSINTTSSYRAQAAPFAYNDEKYQNGMLPSGVASGLALFLRNTSDDDRINRYDLFISSYAQHIVHSNNKASAVNVKNAFIDEFTLIAKCVIVACGGIESAKILHHSSIPDPNNRIGKGIQEHLFYRTFWNGPQLYDQHKVDNAAVFIPSTSQETEQVEIHAPGRFLISTDSEHQWNPTTSPRYEVMIRSFAATRKTEDNFIEFNTNELGGSIVHFSHTSFEDNLKQAMKETVTYIGESLGLELSADGYANIGGSYHEAGGLDMGSDEKNSVVDANGRVHTMENIFVVDASTFPRIGATNPHLTIGAIARKQSTNINI